MPDALIEIAFAALSKAGFRVCAQDIDCYLSDTLWSPSPTRHLHISNELTISFSKSQTYFCIFPILNLLSEMTAWELCWRPIVRLPSAILRRGRGRFLSELSPVRIPSPLKYCEAVILLLCRDCDTARKNYWIAILTYSLEYVDDSDIFNKGALREDYQPFYHAIKIGDSRMYVLLNDLRRDLIERQLFPSPRM
ncbi:hypothetical protein DPV78_002691 [Talaromyces pinophilus]|nr:hypothetical protein DPV78_002691 [Talaromyces pinophilus]